MRRRPRDGHQPQHELLAGLHGRVQADGEEGAVGVKGVGEGGEAGEGGDVAGEVGGVGGGGGGDGGGEGEEVGDAVNGGHLQAGGVQREGGEGGGGSEACGWEVDERGVVGDHHALLDDVEVQIQVQRLGLKRAEVGAVEDVLARGRGGGGGGGGRGGSGGAHGGAQVGAAVAVRQVRCGGGEAAVGDGCGV